MNNYTRSCRKNEPVPRSNKNPGKSWILPFIFKVALMSACIFGAVAYRISYNEKTEMLNREAVRLRKELHRLDLEMAHLKNKKEELSSWGYVSRRIKQYNLALRPAEPSQIKKLRFYEETSQGTGKKVLASDNHTQKDIYSKNLAQK